MKLFRKERKSATSSPALPTPSPLSSHDPPSPKPQRREDKDRDNKSISPRRTSSPASTLQVSFENRTAFVGGLHNSTGSTNSNSSAGSESKKHTIRIGDTRFFGRVLFRYTCFASQTYIFLICITRTHSCALKCAP